MRLTSSAGMRYYRGEARSVSEAADARAAGNPHVEVAEMTSCRVPLFCAAIALMAVGACTPRHDKEAAPLSRSVAFGPTRRMPNAVRQSEGIDFEAIIERAKQRVFPTLVYVRPIREDFSEGKRRRVVVGGSGVIISPDGYVVTNHHVADKAIEIRCVLFDNRMVEAELIGTDQDTDLALLKLRADSPSERFPFAEFADSSRVEEGQFVMALGAPWGLKRSISLGVVSSSQRYLEDSSEYSLWIQSDASLNPGNSGGPLIDTAGKVVGINTLATMMGGDMGFSVPSNTVAYVVEQIKQQGKVKRSWTGLRLQPLRDFNRDSFFDGDRGVLIASVDPDSPADQAGLQPGDLILSVHGRTTDGLYAEDLPHIRDLLGRLPTDEPVAFRIQRDGQGQTLEMTLREKGQVEGQDLDLQRWNMTVKAINEHFDPVLHYYASKGVYVQATRYPGNAQDAGIRQGDIIQEIDRREVTTLEEVRGVYDAVMADTQRRKRVLFKVLRLGVPQLLVLDYTRDYDKE